MVERRKIWSGTAVLYVVDACTDVVRAWDAVFEERDAGPFHRRRPASPGMWRAGHYPGAEESREDAPTSLRCRASLRLREGRRARSITLHSITSKVSRSPFLAA